MARSPLHPPTYHMPQRNRRRPWFSIVTKTVAGKQVRRWSPGQATQKQAEAWYWSQVRDAQPTQVRTVGQLLDDWFERHSRERHLRPSTAVRYRAIIDNLAPLAKVELVDLTRDHLDTYLSSLKLAAPTVKTIVIVIRAALRMAVEDGLISTSPATRLRAPEPAQTDRHLWSHLWTPDEWRRFLDATEPPYTEAYRLLLALGCRRGELLALTWDDVDLATGVVRIHRSLADQGKLGPTKTGKARAVTVDAATLAMLSELPQTGDRLFNISPAMLSRIFRATVKRAGLRPMRLHEVRHLSATMMLRAGVPVYVVSRRLGHARVGITIDTYFGLAQDQDQDATERMAALYA
jgi:integrase